MMNGSSQRHGSRFNKSHSFLLPGLVVVIIILSFNYWRTSRLNRELLTSVSRHQARSDKLDHQIDELKHTGAREVQKHEDELGLLKETLEQQKAACKTEKDELNKDIEQKVDDIADLETENGDLKVTNAKARAQMEQLSNQIMELNETHIKDKAEVTSTLQQLREEKETILSFVASELGREGIEALLTQKVLLPTEFQMPSADQLALCSKRAEEKCKLESKPVQVVADKNPQLQSPNAQRVDLPRGQAQGAGEDLAKAETGNPAQAPGQQGPDQSQGDNPAQAPGQQGPDQSQGDNPAQAPGQQGPDQSQDDNPAQAPGQQGPDQSQGDNPAQAPGQQGPDQSQGGNPAQAPGQQGPDQSQGDNPAQAPGQPLPIRQGDATPAIQADQAGAAAGLKPEEVGQPSDGEDQDGELEANKEIEAGDDIPSVNMINATKAATGPADAGVPVPGLQDDNNEEGDAVAVGDDDEEPFKAVEGADKPTGSLPGRQPGDGGAEDEGGEDDDEADKAYAQDYDSKAKEIKALNRDEMGELDSVPGLKMDTRKALQDVSDDDGEEEAKDEEVAVDAANSQTTVLRKPVVIKQSSGTTGAKIGE